MWGIDAAGWMAIVLSIGWLVILEGLLSADNALILAVMVRHLPRRKQRKALRYGIWGAFLFRLIAVIFASYLLGYWWLKVLGGVYLLHLAVHHFLAGEHETARKDRTGRGFWMTVVNVEIADIAFSVDSILAAVAMSEKLPDHIEYMMLGRWPLVGLVPLKLVIVYIGGVLGIIAMRMVAGVFLILLERFKGLAAGAYLLVAWIGVALVEGGLISALHPTSGQPAAWVQELPAWVRSVPEIPEWFFWTVMALIFFGSMLYRPRSDEEPEIEATIPALAGSGAPKLVEGNGKPATRPLGERPATER